MWEQLTKQEANCVISSKWHPGIYPMCVRGFPLCSVWVRADKSILMKYKYQSLLKQQRQDESSTWHLPQQDLATKLMCWRKASSAIMWQTLEAHLWWNCFSFSEHTSTRSKWSARAGSVEGAGHPDIVWNRTSSEQVECSSSRIISSGIYRVFDFEKIVKPNRRWCRLSSSLCLFLVVVLSCILLKCSG